jgi:hypothetical protein
VKVQLLVSEWCTPCRGAEEVWQSVARSKAIAFEVLDVGQPEGRAVVARLGVRSVPATVIDGMLRHVGVPTPGEAKGLVADAADREAARDASHYVGLTLQETSAAALVSAALYLVLAGASLVFGGGIAGDAPWRAAALHAFGLGFIAFFVFGLGEHLLPRFTGAPIRGGAIAWTELACAHGGTLLLAAGFLAQNRAIALIGGVAALAAIAIFGWRLVPVLGARGAAEA